MHTFKVIVTLFVLLSIIFSLSIFANYTLNTTSKELVQDLQKIEAYTIDSDWENAEIIINELNAKWSNIQWTWSLLIDHFEVDNINIALAKTIQMIKFKDQSSALQEIASLLQCIKHVPEMGKFNIQNIF